MNCHFMSSDFRKKQYNVKPSQYRPNFKNCNTIIGTSDGFRNNVSIKVATNSVDYNYKFRNCLL